jgi:hypothetical protein
MSDEILIQVLIPGNVVLLEILHMDNVPIEVILLLNQVVHSVLVVACGTISHLLF